MGDRAGQGHRAGDRPLIPNSLLLLDTNTLSELTKARPNARVVSFFQRFEPRRAFLSVLTLGELRKGVLHRMKRDQLAANRLAAWVRQVEQDFADRILPINHDVAQLWGELSSQRSRTVVDTLLAATALSRSLTLVTRNVRDVEDTGVLFFNPWDDPDLD